VVPVTHGRAGAVGQRGGHDKEAESAAEVQILAVPGVPCLLDCGVSWVRTGAELDREWPRMLEAVDARAARSQVTPERDGMDRAVLGIYNAAQWTVGDLAIAPVLKRRLPVTGRTLTDELVGAELWSQSGEVGAAYGFGVMSWLLWMVGQRDRVHYPQWSQSDPWIRL
jgi:hypothetical protein